MNVMNSVSDSTNERLVAPLSSEEIKQTVFRMHPDKSSGPDGMNLAFYQNFWHIVGTDVIRNCQCWFELGSLPDGLNDTTIVLIPKRNNPKTIRDLRCTSLCNVIYKVFSKVLANRLREYCPHLLPSHSRHLSLVGLLQIISHLLLSQYIR